MFWSQSQPVKPANKRLHTFHHYILPNSSYINFFFPLQSLFGEFACNLTGSAEAGILSIFCTVLYLNRRASMCLLRRKRMRHVELMPLKSICWSVKLGAEWPLHPKWHPIPYIGVSPVPPTAYIYVVAPDSFRAWIRCACPGLQKQRVMLGYSRPRVGKHCPI
jgi:hypothetical protein